MKKKLVILILGAIAVACSSDDSTNNTVIADTDVSNGEYLPMSDDNYWKYDVEDESQSGSDSIYISGSTTINGKTYKKFQTDEPAIGFYSGTLSGNSVRKEGDRLLATGSATFYLSEGIPLSINLNDFTILNESAANGTVIATVSGTIPYQYEEYTINFNYTLSSIASSHLATYTAPDGTVYTDVKPVIIKLNLSAGTFLSGAGITLPITIMNPQDVLVSTRYFAKDIGVVYADTNIQYQLTSSASLGGELPFPSSASIQQKETLVNFSVE